MSRNTRLFQEGLNTVSKDRNVVWYVNIHKGGSSWPIITLYVVQDNEDDHRSSRNGGEREIWDE